MPSARLLTSVFLLALVLNLLWEFGHCPLYETCQQQTETDRARLLVTMALKDSALITLFYLLVAGTGRTNDVMSARPALLLFIILALGFAWLDETLSLRAGRWVYAPHMPTVFGVGLSPLLELAVTGVATVAIISWLQPRGS